jgi:hypothetical protein
MTAILWWLVPGTSAQQQIVVGFILDQPGQMLLSMRLRLSVKHQSPDQPHYHQAQPLREMDHPVPGISDGTHQTLQQKSMTVQLGRLSVVAIQQQRDYMKWLTP